MSNIKKGSPNQISDLEYSPKLKQYLDFMRSREVQILIVIFVIIEVFILSLTAQSYLKVSRAKAVSSMFKNEDHAGLLRHFKNILHSDPENLAALYNCANSSYQLKQYAEALEYAKQLEQKKSPSYTIVYCLQAKCYYYQKNAEANKYFSYALQLGKYDDEFKVIIGEQLIRNGNYVEAAEWLATVNQNSTFGDAAQKTLRQIEQKVLGALARSSDQSIEPRLMQKSDRATSQPLTKDQIEPALLEYFEKQIKL